MMTTAEHSHEAPSIESTVRVAVVGALSATTMLFASLASAYLVRRSFPDWRPSPELWPLPLACLGLLASMGIEWAARSEGRRRTQGLWALAGASVFYLVGASVVVISIARGPYGLAAPHQAFVALLLGVHIAHALVASGFAAWSLGQRKGAPSDSSVSLIRLVTHFLTALLLFILFLLFVMR